MVKNPKIAALFSGNSLQIGAIWYLVAFILMQLSGLFNLPAPGLLRTLHQWPALAGVAVIMACSITFLAAGLKNADRTIRVGGPHLLLHCGLLVMGTGIILSGLTRFEGSFTLTEGQEAPAMRDALDPSAVYAGPFSSLPDAHLALLEVAPFGMKKEAFSSRKAVVQYVNSENTGGEKMTISGFPRLKEGFFYRIASVGYSPHIQLFDSAGEIIEDAYIVMDIYPPGAEDFFSLPPIPHTFFLRYYPDVSMVPGKSDVIEGKKGPVYKVRISRNIALIVDTYASLEDMIAVDALSLALHEPKPWVEIRIVKDPGLYFIIPGLLMAAAGGVTMLTGMIKKAKGHGAGQFCNRNGFLTLH